MFRHALRVHEHEPDLEVRDRFPGDRGMPGVAEKNGATAVLQQLRELIGVQSSIERDDGAA